MHKVLVVAPLRVARFTWSAEIEKWEHLSGLKYSVAVGTEKERLEAGARRPATEEGPAAQALAAARAQSSAILMARMQTDLVQTGAFAASEFATFAQAGLFTTWAAGQTYARGYRLVHRGIVYEVLQDVTALADQPPDAAGMPAVYRPLSVAPESGDGQADSPGQAASSRDRSATSSIAEASCA